MQQCYLEDCTRIYTVAYQIGKLICMSQPMLNNCSFPDSKNDKNNLVSV